MNGKLFFSSLIAGVLFFGGKVQAQDNPRSIAEAEAKCSYTVKDNYKDQFNDREFSKNIEIRTREAITVNADYKHQTGVKDRRYDKSASVKLEKGKVPGLNYKQHQVTIDG